MWTKTEIKCEYPKSYAYICMHHYHRHSVHGVDDFFFVVLKLQFLIFFNSSSEGGTNTMFESALNCFNFL